ncbi:MAG: tRNA glutamyl-Q(34) synthetase GluQRS [Gammaproteobacteria bacterium]|jgi:glutamyl-Q tRNA(Asp) synthetase|nr:tRNA glutamyl-Q(34) synthetase GluQRS [Gammaproteobacteria bacterium]
MQTRDPIPYVGRFAPSPTGPLHFGSLVAAVASYLQARTKNGQWLLRIEDIDPPREQPGASDAIIEALQCYGFVWDGDVIYQSKSDAEHRSALELLIDQNLAYPCSCSRRDLADAPRGPLGIIYPGTCRNGCNKQETAIRLLTDDKAIVFADALQGTQSHRLESESGDFVIRRRDGLIAYQLAVVVDDELQGVTEVVRGIDLIDSTPRQIYLQRLLQYRTPNYIHIPVIVHANGDKLSKLTGAPAIPLKAPSKTLCAALRALGQEPPASLASAALSDVWYWALKTWQMEKLLGCKTRVNTS